jgi:hypothetical protein
VQDKHQVYAPLPRLIGTVLRLTGWWRGISFDTVNHSDVHGTCQTRQKQKEQRALNRHARPSSFFAGEHALLSPCIEEHSTARLCKTQSTSPNLQRMH